MKYLFIFLPFFAFAKNDSIPDRRIASIDTLFVGGDTLPVGIASSYLNGDITIATHFEWKSCDQHFGEVDHPHRDSVETSEVTLLIWNGCSIAEIKATKFTGYNYGGDWVYFSSTRPKKDFIVWYLSGDKWIKPSYVIKEL